MELAFLREGLISNLPLLYLRTFCPRKSKPASICVTDVFSAEENQTALTEKALNQRLYLILQ